MTLVRVPSMPKSEKPKRDDKSLKAERALVERAQIIARTLGISLAEYVSNLMRPGIERDWPKALKKLNASPSREEAE